ncbi:MAG: hypothetical protein H0V30_04450 [Chitinophagaceae bacterium]|jgi:hypothetical protein|nr:hypothetical protein [Chitinophagaceae bacterium]
MRSDLRVTPLIHTIEKFAWCDGKKINTHLYKNYDAIVDTVALQSITEKLNSKLIARTLF